MQNAAQRVKKRKREIKQHGGWREKSNNIPTKSSKWTRESEVKAIFEEIKSDNFYEPLKDTS